MWQPSCHNCRGGERKNLIGILEMKLPKMEEKIKELSHTSCQNWRKEEREIDLGRKLEEKKKNNGSQVVEIENENGEKLIVAMELLKMGGKKKEWWQWSCPKIGGEREREFLG